MLAVIDYGGGNLGSLLSALSRRGVAHRVVADPDGVREASAAILPGDGAFAATMDALRQRELDRAIVAHIEAGRPFLGICVGMQILFDGSSEHDGARGLGILAGEVTRFSSAAPRVPHMGWNALEITAPHPALQGVENGDYVYFLHSYRVPVGACTAAAATHGDRFTAVVARDGVVATQFHPEKSQRTGGMILENFLRLSGAPMTALHE